MRTFSHCVCLTTKRCFVDLFTAWHRGKSGRTFTAKIHDQVNTTQTHPTRNAACSTQLTSRLSRSTPSYPALDDGERSDCAAAPTSRVYRWHGRLLYVQRQYIRWHIHAYEKYGKKQDHIPRVSCLDRPLPAASACHSRPWRGAQARSLAAPARDRAIDKAESLRSTSLPVSEYENLTRRIRKSAAERALAG